MASGGRLKDWRKEVLHFLMDQHALKQDDLANRALHDWGQSGPREGKRDYNGHDWCGIYTDEGGGGRCRARRSP